ncbi:MAG: hypothetical protein GY714_20010 [Desulfobacterales bacterium]|nr:hypothetical protein [Desulfobacterales bacterium]
MKIKHNYIVENAFIHEGLECTIIFSSMGHRCGYVGVKKDSPLFRVSQLDDLKKPELLKELKQAAIGKRGMIPLFCWDGKETTPSVLFNVHGGITFADGNSCYPITRPYPLWWFGFDCAHYDDAKDWDFVKEVFDESLWMDSYETSKKYSTGGVIRTLDYVEKECQSLAEQIRCVESTY